MNRNQTIAVFVVAVVAIAAVGIAITLKSDDHKVYKIAVVKHNFEPLFIADALGYFDDEGVDVELVSVGSGSLASTALASGQVDLAGFGSDPFLKLIDDYGDTYKYAARWMLDDGLKGAQKKDSSFAFDGTSLKGAKIGVNVTVSYYSLLLKYLDGSHDDNKNYVKQNSIDVYDPNKVNIYHFPNDALSGALTSGNVDIIIAGATNISVVENTPDAYKYVDATESYKSDMSVGLFGKDSFLTENQSDVKKIINAIQKACAYMNDPTTQDDAVNLCMEKLNISNMNVMTKYITLAEWSVGLNTRDSVSIEDSFKYIIKDNPEKYTGTLKELTEIDIDLYFSTAFTS